MIATKFRKFSLINGFAFISGGSNENPKLILHSLGKHFKTPSVQTDVDVLDDINGDRVQKKRLQVIHKRSGIRCWIESDANQSVCESSQIIRDCISHAPICKYFLRSCTSQVSIETMCDFTGYHLIAYVRAWVNALNEAAAAEGAQLVFRFNTYIISVLVIFYLQMNQNFPKLADVPKSHATCVNYVPQNVDKQNLKRSIGEFFKFYGKKYELKNQLISVNIGRWQDPQPVSKKTNLTPEQKRYDNTLCLYHYNVIRLLLSSNV